MKALRTRIPRSKTMAHPGPAKAPRTRPRMRGFSLLLLLAPSLFACRGAPEAHVFPASGFIPIHADARETLAAYQAKDPERLSRALERLGEISEQPELLSGDRVRQIDLSSTGRFLIIALGESLGGSKLLVLDATSGRLLLGLKGYGASFSSDDRWLACLQHRYTTPQPGADVGNYEALLLVDLGRVRGSSPEDTTVFRTIVNDLEGRLVGGRTKFVGKEGISVLREKPPLHVEYTLEGERVEKRGRRWKFLKLF